jgi:hypothetical protein
VCAAKESGEEGGAERKNKEETTHRDDIVERFAKLLVTVVLGNVERLHLRG